MMKKKMLLIIFSIILIAFIVTGCVVVANNGYSSKLYNLINENKTEEAIELIEKTDDVNSYSAPLFLRRIFNAVETDIKLPLVEACKAGNYEIVEALLKKGADPNKYLDGSWTPIEAAFACRIDQRFKIAKLLIEYGADIDLYGSGTSALFLESSYLIHTNDNETILYENIKLLLDNSANSISPNGYTVLHFSVAGNRTEVTKKLIANYYPELNYPDKNGQTPLIWGAEKNAVDTVKLLIEKGADKSIKDSHGKTAYDYAVELGNSDLTELLKP